MSASKTDALERLQFRKRYAAMADDELARLAMDENLVVPAREAITAELEARGLRDLSSFKKQIQEDVAAGRADGLLAFIPESARPQPEKSRRLLGLTGLLMFGLVGIHKWLLGDATTWRKEEALAVWLVLGLFLIWDSMVSALKGQPSRELLLRLVLVALQIAMPAAVMAVPALGRFVSGFNPLLTAAILFSPVIVFSIVRALRRIASRSP